MPAEWAIGAIGAVQRWIAACPDGGSAGHRFTQVGDAGPASEPGWLELPDPGLIAGEWWLAGDEGPDGAGAFLVDDVRRDERGTLLLRVPAGLPADVRGVWADAVRHVDVLLERLRDTRSGDGRAPLAAALARQQLDGAPDRSVPHPVGLSAEQAEAYRACRTPGLRLVWGPVGPRTTAVIARAVTDLAADGHRVLLLAATDEGVDVIVGAVAAGLTAGKPGSIVRVGPTRLDGADGADVALDRLAARETAVDDRRRAVVGHQLATFAGEDPEIAALAAGLGGYDDDAYRRAARRVAAARDTAELEPRRRAAIAVVRTAATHHALAVAARADVARERDEFEPARAALARVDALVEELRRIDRDLRRHRTDQAVARHWAWRGADGRLDRWRRRWDARAADRDRARAEREAGPRRSAAHWDLLQARAAAGRVTAADLAAVDARLADAHAAVLAAATELVRAESYAEELAALAAAARARGEPTDADRELVAAAVRDGLPARYERLVRLRRRRPSSAAALGRLGAEHHALALRSATQRAAARADLLANAVVVATTVAAAATLPSDTYDAVIVEGAAAVPLAETVVAVGAAATTAVLFGDFQQPGPRLAGAVRTLAITDPAVATWVVGTCFSHCRIDEPADAVDADGCVAMLREFRGTHAPEPLPFEPADRVGG